MSEIYRLSVKTGLNFEAPSNVTFGFQAQRGEFSVWYVAGERRDTLYRVVPTGLEAGFESLVATVVLPDGFTVFHLVKVGGAR